ncbi:carbapenem antibiotics biosynthesis protein carD [Paramyrothecium foliicola]|nr:carbapenem antibiotics biosynthesis protein carD [Paramyrothecium foliicola]
MSTFLLRVHQRTLPFPSSLSLVAANARSKRFFNSQTSTQTSATNGIRHQNPLLVAGLATASKRQTGLGVLPLNVLLRSLAVLSVASLPQPLLSFLIRNVKRRSRTIESSSLLRNLLRGTFYNTFCIGEGVEEITRNVDELRRTGIRGVILAFAREATVNTEKSLETPLTIEEPEIRAWVQFNIETIEKLRSGDYLAVRCTGAGKATLRAMDRFSESTTALGADNVPQPIAAEIEAFRTALHEICTAAEEKGIRILIDAEDIKRQVAIDFVSLDLMSRFNKGSHAIILNTYQMYLKAGIAKLRRHLHYSVENNFILGVKMVRGAYIHTEADRVLLHDTKEDTDKCYDDAVRLLVLGDESEISNTQMIARESNGKPWTADVMLATHNAHSAKEALRLYRRVFQGSGEKRATTGLNSLAFAQLKGMADELTLELSSEIEQLTSELGQSVSQTKPSPASPYPSIGIYKYSVWGSFRECLLYMLRRAEENKDAVARSRGTAMAMLKELLRRLMPFRAIDLAKMMFSSADSIATNVGAAAVASATVSPLVSVIDSSIIRKSATGQSIGSCLKFSLKAIAKSPMTLARSRPFHLVFGVYFFTYATANFIDSAYAAKEGLSPATQTSTGTKFVATTAVSTGLCIYKDARLARLFGVAQSAVPMRSYQLFLLRDAVTVYACFNLPTIMAPWLAHLASSTEMGRYAKALKSEAVSLKTSQLLLPAMVQLVSTPIHLLGLDYYNKQAPISIWTRLRTVRDHFGPSVMLRVLRIVPAFGVGNVINTEVRQARLGSSREKKQENAHRLPARQ